MIKLTT